jgi:hypothetical protein
MKKNIKSTYDRITADPKRKANIEREYQKLVKTEKVLALQEDNWLSNCSLSHAPNEKTLGSIENIEKGKNLVESKDHEDFLKKLGL